MASVITAARALEFEVSPNFVENPSGRVPLAGAVTFKSEKGLTTDVAISDGTHSWQISFSDNESANGTYEIPIVGMRADREHTIAVTITNSSGKTYEETFSHTTPPLPDNQLHFPPLRVEVSEPERMEPGVTFLSVRRRALGRGHWLTDAQLDFSMKWGMLIAVDSDGEVVWYFQSDSRTAGIDRLKNGNIVMHRADFSTVEIDLLGNVKRQFYAEKRPLGPPENPNAIPIIGQQTLHHQPHELPDGNFLAFSANAYLIEDYPTSELDPEAPKAAQMVMADTVVIFDQQGEQIWSWNTLDYLDPFRIGYDTFWSYWWTRGFDDHVDWSHGNGLSYNAADDSILASFRNQAAVVKIDRISKEIKWILGRPDGWPERLKDKLLTPVGDLLWFGYQHNPRYTHKGTVILFDNRANGARMPFEPRPPFQANWSRGVEYEIDDEAMTVKQIWASTDENSLEPCFSNAMSDAWRLPKTDNRLVIHVYCLPLDEGLTEDIMDPTKRAGDDLPFAGGPVLEFAGDKVVFRMNAQDPDDLIQWEFYGGFRSPLYLGEDRAPAH